MEKAFPEGVQKVWEALQNHHYQGEIFISEHTIFTVEDASRAVGVPPEEILKSLVLLADGSPVLALLSGTNKVHLKKIKKLLQARKVVMSTPEFVLDYSGFQVGGVPPLGYPEPIQAFLDEDLFLHETVWAAGGSDHAFFPIAPSLLLEYVKGRKEDIKKEPLP